MTRNKNMHEMMKRKKNIMQQHIKRKGVN